MLFMEQYWKDCLREQEQYGHLMPFLWLHGEDKALLKAELDAIEQANIRQFCAESRVFEDFCGDTWWDTFGFLLEEAKKRGMRVWLLDDKRFPTGYANGYIERHPDLRKTVLRAEYRDFAGPQAQIHILPPDIASDEHFVSICAYRRTQDGNSFTREGIDLLPRLHNGLISWDIPEGIWRVYYLISSHNVTFEKQWIDMLNPQSCRGQIEAVYQPVYDHFKEYFGNTFAGFFSDEPRFGNDGFCFNSALGKPGMVLPWREDLPQKIAEALGIDEEQVRLLAPMLFYDCDDPTLHALRLQYMEIVTKLYRENFTGQLSAWCHSHGVQYIGHIIEDMNAHQRLGYGPGHYFRALDQQDMSGMDIVLHQIMPGNLEIDHSAPVSFKTADTTFYHYYLAKLPVSLSAMTPAMQGRSMCEIFGAFGWVEGIPMMKQLSDHMFSNGINYFVPHAFTPKFPDPDCPPHFYANGQNPQFEAFGCLMQYMQRCAAMLSSGTPVAPVGVLYTPQAEWSGGKAMLGQHVGKVLIQNQLDYLLLWEDILSQATVEQGKLSCHKQYFEVLVIPESQFLSDGMICALQDFIDSGLTVIHIGQSTPTSTSGRILTGCRHSDLQALPKLLREMGVGNISVSENHPYLRYHHRICDGKHLFFFHSEDYFNETHCTVTLPGGPYRVYDAWNDRLYTPQQEGHQVQLQLPTVGSVLLIEDESDAPVLPKSNHRVPEIKNVAVSVCNTGETVFQQIDAAIGQDLSHNPQMGDFGGTVRYMCDVIFTGEEQVIQLNRVGEIARIWLDDMDLGWTVSRPYSVKLPEHLQPGAHRLQIDVVCNQAYRHRDSFSTYLPLPPIGLLGPITV